MTKFTLIAVVLTLTASPALAANEPTGLMCELLESPEKTIQQRARPDGLLNTKGLSDIVDWPRGERDGYDFRDVNTVVNVFHYENLKQMAQFDVPGKPFVLNQRTGHHRAGPARAPA